MHFSVNMDLKSSMMRSHRNSHSSRIRLLRSARISIPCWFQRIIQVDLHQTRFMWMTWRRLIEGGLYLGSEVGNYIDLWTFRIQYYDTKFHSTVTVWHCYNCWRHRCRFGASRPQPYSTKDPWNRTSVRGHKKPNTESHLDSWRIQKGTTVYVTWVHLVMICKKTVVWKMQYCHFYY